MGKEKNMDVRETSNVAPGTHANQETSTQPLVHEKTPTSRSSPAGSLSYSRDRFGAGFLFVSGTSYSSLSSWGEVICDTDFSMGSRLRIDRKREVARIYLVPIILFGIY